MRTLRSLEEEKLKSNLQPLKKHAIMMIQGLKRNGVKPSINILKRYLIKENHGLHEDDVISKHMIPTTFNEETEILSNSNKNSLKRHYMTFYWKMRKYFLDFIEDSMSHDSLIGSTISTISKKNVSCASKISYPSILSHDAKTSKISEKDNPHDFYPKNFNHAFLSKPDFKGYKNNATKEFEENQNYVGEEFHQEPDHPSTFMKMVKERTRTMSAVNVERRQVLPSKVIWDRTIDRFEVFRNNVEGNYGQIGAGYLFGSSFQEAYFERGVDCYADFLDEVPSASQIKKDARALHGALLSAFQSGVGRRILMENRHKQDCIRSWCQLLQQYETDGNRNVRIKRLESVINTVFHRNYRGELVKWIHDYKDAFTELASIGQKTWNDDQIKKRHFVQNAQNIGLVDTVLKN
jgi:hypothetical protein